jgi:hypothetical protein
MASQIRVQDVKTALSRPSRSYHAGRPWGGRRPAGGGLISGPPFPSTRLPPLAAHFPHEGGGAGHGVGARGVVRTRGWGRGPARRGLTVCGRGTSISRP